MYANNEPIELLRIGIKEMQTSLLMLIKDKTLDRDQLREMHRRLGRMEQAVIDKLGISFAHAVEADDDSEIDHDLDN
ncbi:hypothetical protein Scep_006739 [Stephania cephalantha]|uniref:Uncharacterized protein n=1 Tax=Stephania cephalantha TaxID=152367 RepID=A0AAP0PL43_9MAGN